MAKAPGGYGHWDVSLVGEFDPEDHIGFVYQITHLLSGRSYIGCKHLWKHRKRKRVAASEWRSYCSSSDKLKPVIAEQGRDAFRFQILMLCNNRRNLYYNEAKLQFELGVLEDDTYYNANIGGMRFFRPVTSYLSEELRAKLRAAKLGTRNPAYRGSFVVSYTDGTFDRFSDITVVDWCKQRKYSRTQVTALMNRSIKTYKGMIGIKYDN